MMDGPDVTEQPRGILGLPHMLFQNTYVWLIFVSALDIMLTWAILSKNGTEVNPVARLVIESWGLWGAIGFKFALMLFVIIVCEVVGRSQYRTGRNLARVAVGVSGMPPAWSLGLLAYHTWTGTGVI